MGVTVATDAERQVVPGGADGLGQNVGGDHQIDPRVQQRRRIADAITVTLQVDLQEPHVDVAGFPGHRPQVGEQRPPGSHRNADRPFVRSVHGHGETAPGPLGRWVS